MTREETGVFLQCEYSATGKNRATTAKNLENDFTEATAKTQELG